LANTNRLREVWGPPEPSYSDESRDFQVMSLTIYVVPLPRASSRLPRTACHARRGGRQRLALPRSSRIHCPPSAACGATLGHRNGPVSMRSSNNALLRGPRQPSVLQTGQRRSDVPSQGDAERIFEHLIHSHTFGAYNASVVRPCAGAGSSAARRARVLMCVLMSSVKREPISHSAAI
jgi:hypothetical protein